MIRKLTRALWRWPLMLVAATLAFGLLFAHFAVDPLARWMLPKLGERLLDSRLQAERVTLDPLRLQLTIEGLRLARRDGEPLAGFARLVVDLEAAGALRWTWHFREIRLTAPQARVDIAPDGRLNWAELLARLGAGEPSRPKDPASLPRVRVDRLLVEDGGIEYLERDRPTPFQASLRPLALTLEGLSTVDATRGRYLFTASLPEQGGTVRAQGDLALNPPASDGALELDGLKPGRILEAVRSADLPVAGVQGELAARLKYGFALAAGSTPSEPRTPQAQVSDLSLELNGFAADLRRAGTTEPQAQVKAGLLKLRVPSLAFSRQADRTAFKVDDASLALDGVALARKGAPLFSLAEARVQGAGFDLATRELKVADVLLQAGQVQSRRGQDLQLDWQQLADALTPAAAPPASAPDASPGPEPGARPLRFAIDRVRLSKWQLRHADAGFTHPIEASVQGIELQLAVDNHDTGIQLKDMQGEVTGIRLQSSLAPQPLATLARVAWREAGVHLGERDARIGSLAMAGLQTQVQRRADGSLDWQALLATPTRAGKAPASGRAQQPPAQQAQAAKPWTATLARIAIQDAAVRLEDRAVPQPVALDLRAGLELQSVSLDLSRPIPLTGRIRIAQGGEIALQGRVTPARARAELALQLDQLALKPFSPYLNQPTLLKVDDGRVSVRGNLSVDAAGPLQTRFRGGFSVNQLAVSRADTSEPFVAWKEVSSDSVTLSLAPDRLHLQALRIVEPVGQFIIHEDGTLNATRILRNPPAAAPAPQAAAVATPPVSRPSAEASAASAASAAPAAFPVAIERVSIDGASVDFADLTLRPQFGARIDKLSGVINGLSNDPATLAQVELDGQVDDFGSARVRGTIQPFRATQFTDLRLTFRNLEMSRLTPYSGKFAGRKIESGKLSVDLEYKIKERMLAGENKFVVNKLKLGDRVDSPTALRLPLDLAIAILEDSDGVIDLDLPVSGSLDDPQFSYGKIIWKAIGNVLTRIVTAPFRALASLFGNAEQLQAIGFEPGSASLSPPEQEKLRSVAQVLARRPALSVTVVPAFDAASDTAALQEQAMRRAVLAEAGQALREGEAPGPLDLNNARIQAAVERLLQQRAGGSAPPKATDATKTGAEASAARPPDAQRHAAMLPALRATFPAPAPQLTALAVARAEAMRTYLTGTAGIEAGRLALGPPAEAAGDGSVIPLKLELGARAAARAP